MITIPHNASPAGDQILLQMKLPAAIVRALRVEAAQKGIHPRDIVLEHLSERYHGQRIGKSKPKQ